MVLDATGGSAYWESAFRFFSPQRQVRGAVLHAPEDAQGVTATLAATGGRWQALGDCGDETGTFLRRLLERDAAGKAAYVPCGIEFDAPALAADGLAGEPDAITPLLPATGPEAAGGASLPCAATGWIAPKELALAVFGAARGASGWGLPAMVAAVERGGRHWRWNSRPVDTGETAPPAAPHRPAMSWRSRVLAVVPHFGCEQWLAQCLYALTTQTREPESIVVIDDASPELPVDIVRAFPGVTLLAAPVNIGPENILQNVIQAMDYDAYMVQDADDWCAATRLQRSLEEAERTGAGIVGAQEMRFPTGAREPVLRLHPLDVNRAIAKRIDHYLCHGTSLIAREAARRVGGFDMTLQVAADTDFVLRSSRVCRIANLPEAHYYRRMRPGSRTSAANTGQGSALRDRERDFIFDRARRQGARVERAAAVATLDFESAVEFRHVLGPPLQRSEW